MAFKKYVGLPVEVEAAEIVHVQDYDAYDNVCRVKIRDGGRLFMASCHHDHAPVEGDFLIAESGDYVDGYVCPAAIFSKKYVGVGQ